MYYYNMNLYLVYESYTETFDFFQTPKMRLFLGFLDKVLLGKATNYLTTILPYLQKQKFYTCGPNVSYFASMIEVKFTRWSKL